MDGNSVAEVHMAEVTEEQLAFLEEALQAGEGDLGLSKARIYLPAVVAELRRLRALQPKELQVAAEVAIARERRACAAVAAAWAEHYPTSVFPRESESREAAAAEMARHTSRMIAEAIRDRSDG